MKTWFRAASLAGIAAMLAVGVTRASAQVKPAAADLVCATCHEETVKAFSSNPHGRAEVKGPTAGTCAACHGDGSKHAIEGDKGMITVPRAAAGAKACLACHEKSAHMAFTRTGMHGDGAVSCGDCHTVHHTGVAPRALLKKAGAELCVSCHAAARHSFRKPYAHELSDASKDCLACHNPHGGKGARSLQRTRTGELPCLGCHTDKSGPFAFAHGAAEVKSCMACHEPHGSNNQKMLTRSQVGMLCLECHSTLTSSTLGSQPPSFHDSRSARYQNCTVCHVAIHGSNSSPALLK